MRLQMDSKRYENWGHFYYIYQNLHRVYLVAVQSFRRETLSPSVYFNSVVQFRGLIDNF